jgi:uncharacterized protein YutE (UPF0331/DUF86 family)
MTPPSQAVLSQKLDSLARCIERIESKKPFTTEQLERDFDLQDILSVNLERAVQACADIAAHCISASEEPVPAPATLSESFKTLAILGWISVESAERMMKAAGFRNIVVHEYQKINWAIAFAVAYQHLDDFRQFAREVVARAGLE